MGADGHVIIYDLDKAIELGIIKDPENKESSGDISIYHLDRILRSNHVHIQSIFDHQLITVYWDTERFYMDWNSKLTEQEEKIAKKLNDECYIDTWEVWT